MGSIRDLHKCALLSHVSGSFSNLDRRSLILHHRCTDLEDDLCGRPLGGASFSLAGARVLPSTSGQRTQGTGTSCTITAGIAVGPTADTVDFSTFTTRSSEAKSMAAYCMTSANI
eukprot:6462972-Amphidinium_carterae.1